MREGEGREEEEGRGRREGGREREKRGGKKTEDYLLPHRCPDESDSTPLTDVLHLCDDYDCAQHYGRYEHGSSN